MNKFIVSVTKTGIIGGSSYCSPNKLSTLQGEKMFHASGHGHQNVTKEAMLFDI